MNRLEGFAVALTSSTSERRKGTAVLLRVQNTLVLTYLVVLGFQFLSWFVFSELVRLAQTTHPIVWQHFRLKNNENVCTTLCR